MKKIKINIIKDQKKKYSNYIFYKENILIFFMTLYKNKFWIKLMIFQF